MKRAFFAIAFSASAVVAWSGGGARASAESTPVSERVGVDLGLRIGFALPSGYVGFDGRPSVGLSELVSYGLPLGVEAGLRLGRWATIGPFFQYVGGRPSDSFVKLFPPSHPPSASVIHAGLQGQHVFRAGKRLRPRVGLGLGYEWLRLKVASPPASPDASFQESSFRAGGFALFFQTGVDVALDERWSAGPFIGTSMAWSIAHGGPASFYGGLQRDADLSHFHALWQCGVALTSSF